MRKYIIPLICYSLILLVLLNVDKISDFLTKTISNNNILTVGPGNDYTKDYNFLYIENSDDYIPYSYNDLKNILYSVINQGWMEFTFYCPSEYKECIEDISKISKDDLLLTHINNYVHPYNSFKTISFTYSESGKFSLIVEHLYSSEQITAINYVVDEKINSLIKDSMSNEEKIKVIHNYIIDNAKYDTLKTENIHDDTYKSNTAYGVLIEGYGICSGYSDAISVFLNKLGINNYKISNDTHIWNLVYINGVWVHLDATWDDPVSEFNENRDTYFLINTEELLKLKDDTHSFDKNIYIEAN